MYSVIIPWCNRQELGPALKANRHLFRRHSVETVVVNGGGNDEALVRIVRAAGMPEVRIVSLPDVTFSRSLCLNVGAAVSEKEFLFFLDADIIVTSDVFELASSHLKSGSRYATIQSVIDPDRQNRHEVGRPNMSFLERFVETKEYHTVDGRRAELKTTMIAGSHPGDGLVFLTRGAMYGVGGLNSTFVGWGFEDTDLQLRLQFLLGLERVSVGEVTHIPHLAPRTQRLAWQENFRTATENYSRGNYKGTLVADTEHWSTRLIEWKPA